MRQSLLLLFILVSGAFILADSPGSLAGSPGEGPVVAGPPAPAECPPYPPARTGQTLCWLDHGETIPCDGTGQDGEYQNGPWVVTRFTDRGDGTVLDNLTGLVWLRDASCLGDDYWIHALLDVDDLADGSCELTDGSLPGDWRLPNVRELYSLVDYGRAFPTLPPEHPFLGVQPSTFYMTSTPGVQMGVLCVSFRLGEVVSFYVEDAHFWIWPVRGPE